jgi:hypothetical protein
MIKITIIVLCLMGILTQDAVLAPSDPFGLQLREVATYHQSYLVEIDPQQYNPEWSILYAHQAAQGHSVVELEFEIVNKQFPERQGHRLSKCRLEDRSNRWCKVDVQGFHIHTHLIKLKLDCVSDCHTNITVGFAHREWKGDQLPIVMGRPLEQIEEKTEGPKAQDNKAGLKMIGLMVLTLVLVLLAIQLGEKIAFKFDEKVQRDRMESLRTHSTPSKHSKD